MSKVCPNCQTENKDAARFCYNCATPLITEIVCPQCGTGNLPQARFCYMCATALTPSGALQTGMLSPRTLLAGRYMIVQRAGSGGMGAVYQVSDTRIPGKLWAVKEMSDAAITSPLEKQKAQQAFMQEAQLLATLSHPNLPSVTDFFAENNKQYLVMEFIEGEVLEDMLANAPGPLPEAQVIAWGTQLCDVLGYLHSRKPPVIFRDLKPANVMVDADGKLKLIDFGIARLFKPGQARDTAAFGTSGYAPPEQYGQGQTDARADLYALGVLLHQLATRYDPTITPFSLPPARRVNPAVSARLETVIIKATQTEIHARYQDAAEMRKELSTKEQLSQVAPISQKPAPVLPSSGKAISSSQIITSQNASHLQELHSLVGHTGQVRSIAFAPNGKTLASGSNDRTVRLWDVTGGTIQCVLVDHDDAVYSIAISSDGTMLAAGSYGEVKVWDMTREKVLYHFTEPSGWVNSVAFAPQIMLLGAGSYRKVDFWNIADSNSRYVFNDCPDYVMAIAFTSDAATLAAGLYDGSIQLWNVTNIQKVSSLTAHESTVKSIAFSSDGAILASGGQDNTIKLWEVRAGRNIRVLKTHNSSVYSIAISPDNVVLAFAGFDGKIILWDIPNSRKICTLNGHTKTVNNLAFSSDGTLLASGSDDGTIKIWGM